jgi:hypothetical protein
MHFLLLLSQQIKRIQLKHLYLIIGFSLLLLFSCKNNNCFYNSGEIVVEKRVIDSYSTLHIEDVFIIDFVPDTADFVEIEAGENVIPGIETELKDSILTIRNSNRCNWVRDLKDDPHITIHAKKIRNIELLGASEFYMKDTLIQDYFEFNISAGISITSLLLKTKEFHFGFHSGTGDISLKGSSEISYLFNAGSGYLWAKEFYSDQLYTTNASTGDSYVHAAERLVVRLRSLGDIYYTGNPEISITEKLSSGNLIENNK